jgi:hypothetical protein
MRYFEERIGVLNRARLEDYFNIDDALCRRVGQKLREIAGGQVVIWWFGVFEFGRVSLCSSPLINGAIRQWRQSAGQWRSPLPNSGNMTSPIHWR